MSGALLVVAAVEAEADAIRAGLAGTADHPLGAADAAGPRTRAEVTGPSGVTVAAVGVGPAAAAAGTARLLALAEAAGRPYRAVLSAGIGGAIPGRAAVGGTVLGSRSVAADLGAESPYGFLSLDELGFGRTVLPADPALLAALRAALPTAVTGDVLTVGTATGTARRLAELTGRHPDAVAEAMEGYGVACAAAGAGTPFAELRTISNPVGPRDRSAWRIGPALAALRTAAATLTTATDAWAAAPDGRGVTAR